MIFKVLYQETKVESPKREATKALYIKADNPVEARAALEKNTDYNIEYIEELSEKHLAYEQESPEFHLTEF